MSEQLSQFSSTTEFYRPVEVFVPQPVRHRYWIHALLLLATVFTTLVVGARMQFNFSQGQPAFYAADDSLPIFPLTWALQSSHLLMGIPFSLTLMLILLAHEMGHYVYSRRYGVSATLPFFIPFPTLIGTLGAFIRIRSPIRSRTMLFDIGIAGPIAGFSVAVPVLAIALGMSKAAGVVDDGSSFRLGYPLIFPLVQHAMTWAGLARGLAALPLDRVLLHPVAIAAWVGMFATALNLLPGGQLDGGHIVFSLAPRAHKIISSLAIAALLPMAYFFWAGWLIWAILLRVTGMRHPVVPEWPGITGGRRWLALFAVLMLVLTLTPAPFAHSSLPDLIRELRQ